MRSPIATTRRRINCLRSLLHYCNSLLRYKEEQTRTNCAALRTPTSKYTRRDNNNNNNNKQQHYYLQQLLVLG
jgi:hypothetical protein